MLSMLPPASSGTPPSLDNCIIRIANGEEDALTTLYRQARTAVYGFALSIVKNVHDAEDILQDTFLVVWQKAGSYRPNGKPMAWLMTITRRLAIDRLREHTRTVPLSPEDWQTWLSERPDATQEDRLILSSLLEQLGDQERQIVILHALTGLKHREIAELLAIPLPTVLSKYNRALKKLQKSWKESD